MHRRRPPVRRRGFADAGAGAPPPDPSPWVASLGTVAGALAGAVVIVTLIGGIVMWLRARAASVPADQAVALMSREQLLTAGLRSLYLPALVSTVIGALIVWSPRRRWEPTSVRVARVIAATLAVTLLLCIPLSSSSLAWFPVALIPTVHFVRAARGRAPSLRAVAASVVVATLGVTLCQ
jgi:hypothetical protein